MFLYSLRSQFFLAAMVLPLSEKQIRAFHEKVFKLPAPIYSEEKMFTKWKDLNSQHVSI